MAMSAATDSTGDVTDQGLLASDPSAANTSPLVAVANPNDSSSNGGLISSLEGWASSAGSSIENVGSEAISAVENGATNVYSAGKTVVSDVASGVGNAGNKILGAAEGAVSSVSMNLVLIIVALGAALYFAGKSGGLKLSI